MRRPRLAAVLLAVLAFSFLAGRAAPAEAGRTLTKRERALVAAINRARVVHGVRRLRLRWPLQARTHRYARVLMRTDRFVHASLPRGVRENLALGSNRLMDARAVVRMWLRSPAHRWSLLWPHARYIGAGVAVGSFAGYSHVRIAVARFSR